MVTNNLSTYIKNLIIYRKTSLWCPHHNIIQKTTNITNITSPPASVLSREASYTTDRITNHH